MSCCSTSSYTILSQCGKEWDIAEIVIEVDVELMLCVWKQESKLKTGLGGGREASLRWDSYLNILV